MPKVKVKLPQGEAEASVKGNAADALKNFKGMEGVIAARMDGRLVDLSHPIEGDCEIEPIFLQSPEGLEVLRHTTSHVMAQAVKELFPEVKVTIGPATEEGFYYDFARETPFSEDDLGLIEARMGDIARRDLPLVRKELSKEEAIRLFEELGEDYKVEIIREIPEGDTISVYWQGDFVDLCRGPHLPSTGWLKSFKLLSVAGAYWRGDERNPMLQRIYGTAFPTQEELQAHLRSLEEAKRRDHRRLGRELELFTILEEAGAGLVIYMPKGAIIRSILEDLEKREHIKRGYQLVYGPQLLRMELWERSGHLSHYKDYMYFTEVEGQNYALKPMNCLAHMLIYKSRMRSYRDLPLRYFEMGTVHRHEKSGVLHGLLRVRGFTQDDAHIICRPDQLVSEIRGVLNFAREIYDLFKFDYEVELSTRPQNYIGSDEDWQRATSALMEALEEENIPYLICRGEGAFYGPKIDLKLKDALNRKWQCSTIQCDFALPERFDLTYMGPDGQLHRPAMIHRVILGAIERFLGILIEHYAGAFPTWLAPVQVRVLTVTERADTYAEEVCEALKGEGLRVEKDLRNEKIGYKIREAQLQKTPYMLVIGDREVKDGVVSPRRRDGKQLPAMGLAEFLSMIKEEIRV